MRSAAIIVVGNEILNGTTTDTNSGWVARQITGRGATVNQITTVPDDSERIQAALEHSKDLSADLVITLGGLGPTRDDRTLEAVASHARLLVEENTEALKIVDQRYRVLAEEGRVSDPTGEESVNARKKMARFPAGAEALFNDVGAAPAMHLPLAEYGVLSLPGVPRELKSIVLNHATHVFEKWIGSGAFRSVTVVTSTNDESALSGVLRDFDEQAPENTYAKSRPRSFGRDIRMNVTLSARGKVREEVDTILEEAQGKLISLLGARNIELLEKKYDV